VEFNFLCKRRERLKTVKHLVAPTRYPYQFAANYQKYGDHLDQLPVDAHLLIALIAPRPVLLQTGDSDLWSDPKGEFLAAIAAGPVYRCSAGWDWTLIKRQLRDSQSCIRLAITCTPAGMEPSRPIGIFS